MLRIYHRDGGQAKDLDDGCNGVKDAHDQGSGLEARHPICGRNGRVSSTLGGLLGGWRGRGLTDIGLCYQPKGAHLHAKVRTISQKFIWNYPTERETYSPGKVTNDISSWPSPEPFEGKHVPQERPQCGDKRN